MAAFAAEALTWKRDLATTRTALAETLLELERYIALAKETTVSAETSVGDRSEPPEPASFQPSAFETAVGTPTTFEPAGPPVTAPATPNTDFVSEATDDGSPWAVGESPAADPLDAIFEMTLEPEHGVETTPEEIDPEVLREQRVAAAAANLWKRKGVLTPQER